MNQNNSNLPATVQDCRQLLAWIILQLDKMPRLRRYTEGGFSGKDNLLRMRSFGQPSRSISLNKSDYSPQSIKPSDTKSRTLATNPVPAQPPNERIETILLQGLENLIETSYTKSSAKMSQRANLKLDKVRPWVAGSSLRIDEY